MIKFDVKSKETIYDIVISEKAINELGNYIGGYDKILVLTNTTVGELYLDKVLKQISEDKRDYFIIEDGEKYKNLETANAVYSYLIEKNFSRKSLIVCLGGGVVCDLGGFVASTFMRGIDFLQIPTSLLAQVDASIGGKVAINHKLGKNLIGAFKQPKAVIIDIEFLKTLPCSEFNSGMGEIIKHALLDREYGYLNFLKENVEGIKNLLPEVIEEMIGISCQIKKSFVEEDEFEKGRRALLNLGHTYAHMLETLFDYKNISHGLAVSKGVIFELYLAHELGNISKEKIQKIQNLYELFGIDCHPIYIEENKMLEIMQKDKKNNFNSINFLIFEKDEFFNISVEKELILKVNSKFKSRILKGVIDIGTNSCRLFIAEIEKSGFGCEIKNSLYKDLEVSRLGKNLNTTGLLSKESMHRTFEIIEKFKKKSQEMGVSELIAFATSATREAKNGNEFVQQLKEEYNVNTMVIPGEIEAKLSFNGNVNFYETSIMTVDVGGGSTEFALGTKENIEYIKSFPIGVVKLTEMFFAEDIYSEEMVGSAKNYLKGFFQDICKFSREEFKLIGVAGTVTTNVSVYEKIPQFDPEKIDNYILTKEMLEENLRLYLSCDLNERKDIVGLSPERADIIISGTLILLAILENLEKNEIIVSVKDNLEGGMLLNI